jgi:RNA polymerase sigma-70 factor (ECF subfamily)
MSNGEVPMLERLLAQEGWLRRLARALVADASLADDVAQETWARVLERPPQSVEAPRAWLARVARRVVGERVRADRNRARRERLVASERVEAADDPAFAERVEAAAQVQRSLARAVLALSEPGRSTVVLRYFEGRSSAQIARDTGVPESTVRNRLRRALAELRAELERASGGGRDAWLGALAPLAFAKTPPLALAKTPPLALAKTAPLALAPEAPLARSSPTLLKLGMIMGLKTKLAVALGVVLVAALPFVLDSSSPTPAEVAAPPAPELVALAPLVEAPDGHVARTPTSAPEPEPAPTRAAAQDAKPADVPSLAPGVLEVLVVRGRGADGATETPVTDGRVWLGLSGVFLPRDLEADPEATRVASLDAFGVARFHGVPHGQRAVGVQLGHAPIVQSSATVRAAEGARLVVRLGGGGVRGTVYDYGGAIVAGARMQFSRASRDGETPKFFGADRVNVVTWTDAEGRFEVLHLPSGTFGVGVDFSGVQNPNGGEYNVLLEVPAETALAHDFGQPGGWPLWRGVVRTATGDAATGQRAALGGGSLRLRRTDTWGFSNHPWNEDGSFAIRVEPGAYSVQVRLPGRSKPVGPPHEIVIERRAHDDGEGFERDLVIPGATVAGVVGPARWISLRETPDAAPLVWMERAADGRYRVDGVPPGTWWLTADERSVQFVVAPTDTLVTVDLH